MLIIIIMLLCEFTYITCTIMTGAQNIWGFMKVVINDALDRVFMETLVN